MKYIDAEKLKAEIERFSATEFGDNTLGDDVAKGALDYVLEEIIPSLQQEQPKDKQIIIITESHGDANIEWDCRSLDDVIALLKSAESFITEKQVEELRGRGSEPDYNTTEGRFRNAHKFQQEQPEVDMEKELDQWRHEHFAGERDGHYSGEYLERSSQLDLARHFYELGLNARKEGEK